MLQYNPQIQSNTNLPQWTLPSIQQHPLSLESRFGKENTPPKTQQEKKLSQSAAITFSQNCLFKLIQSSC